MCTQLFCVLGGIAPSEARVTINNSYLGEIPDIVKKATGSDFPELTKHSLLYTECIANSKTDYYIQSKIFTFAKDGSVSKEYTFPKVDASIYSANEILNSVHYSPLRLAVSNQPFGKRYNAVYFTGVHNNGGIYGGGLVAPAQTIVDVSAQSVSSRLVLKNQQYGNYSSKNDDENLWDSGALTVKGLNKDVFVYAHSPAYRGGYDTSGSLVLDFLAVDRNETGSVSMQTSLHTFKVMDYGESWYSESIGDEGCGLETEVYRFRNEEGHYSYDASDKYLGASIAAGDFDGDGQTEIAVIYLAPEEASYSYYAPTKRNLMADVVKYRTSSRRWDRSSQVLFTASANKGYLDDGQGNTAWDKLSTFLAAKADLDEDGKDEIALLTFILDNTTTNE